MKNTKGAGSHSEIYAVNELLNARPGAVLSDMHVYTMELYFGKFWGTVKPACRQCDHILQDVNYIKD